MRIHYKTPERYWSVSRVIWPSRNQRWYFGTVFLPELGAPGWHPPLAPDTCATRAASSTITVGSQLHDELAGVTPLTPEQEAAIDRVLGDMPHAELDGVRHQAGVHAAFARMAKLSDKTMREIRERSDRLLAEREAAAERAARKVERWAEVAFVTLLAIGFLTWAW